MDDVLITAGIACLIAAIVGGGLTAFGIKIPVLDSVRRQILLAILGVILLGLGLAERWRPQSRIDGAANNTAEVPIPPAPTEKSDPSSREADRSYGALASVYEPLAMLLAVSHRAAREADDQRSFPPDYGLDGYEILRLDRAQRDELINRFTQGTVDPSGTPRFGLNDSWVAHYRTAVEQLKSAIDSDGPFISDDVLNHLQLLRQHSFFEPAIARAERPNRRRCSGRADQIIDDLADADLEDQWRHRCEDVLRAVLARLFGQQMPPPPMTESMREAHLRRCTARNFPAPFCIRPDE